jgi:branched-chain amino acid transport system permease protein
MSEQQQGGPGRRRVRGESSRQVVADVVSGARGRLVLPVAAALLVVAFPFLDGNPYWIREISLIAALVLVVSGVNLTFGYAGEVQFGQVFMFAAGAYLTMALAVHGINEIVPLMLIGGLAASAIGLCIALPAIRIGGWSLAMASLFLVITIPDLVTIFSNYTGGQIGLTDIPTPELFGHALSSRGLYEVAVIATIIWLACYRNLVTSRYGVIFRALRESPILTRSIGFSTVALKTTTYCLGAFPAGMAGCLFGYVSLILEPGTFGITLAIGIVAASVLGGVESVYGCIIGAAVLQLGPEKSLTFANYAPIAYGLFLIVAAVALRRGLAGFGLTAAARAGRWIAPPSRPGSEVNAAPLVIDSRPGREVDPGREVYKATRQRVDGRDDDVSQVPTDGRMAAGAALVIELASKHYGGVHALRNVSLTAKTGSVTALIGSNGSGKTTLLNMICGYSSLDSGTIRFKGYDLSQLAPHRIARLGVGRTFQTPLIPRGVRVQDVVASGRYRTEPSGFIASIFRLPRYRRSRAHDREAARTALALAGIADQAGQEASMLPLGTRRLTEVARAMCGDPELLLLDEPASGLSESEVERLGQILAQIARSGAAVVVIEHNFGFVTRIADTVHVLHQGSLIASGPASAVANDPQVIESYLGTSSTEPEPEAAIASGPSSLVHGESQSRPRTPLLELAGVESGYGDLHVLRGISLSVLEGTVEVVLGRNGVGKTTLLGTIAGNVHLRQGAVLLGGVDVGRRPAYRRAGAGIALVQEGKRIFRHRTVWENVMIGTYSLRLTRADRKALCQSTLARFPALETRAHESAGVLSGGQQQMLAMAQALASRPRILLLDEPSAGLAPSIVSDVFSQVRELTRAGLTVVLVEQLAHQAIAIADHVTVLDNGRVAAEGPPSSFSDLDNLRAAYFGRE